MYLLLDIPAETSFVQRRIYLVVHTIALTVHNLGYPNLDYLDATGEARAPIYPRGMLG